MLATTGRRQRDRRAAVIAGILSALGIRPPRPRTPGERFNAAMMVLAMED